MDNFCRSTSCIFLFLVTALSLSVYGQRNCGTAELFNEQLLINGKFKSRRLSIEKYHKTFGAEVDDVSSLAVVTIPVVVHIVYKNGVEKIARDRIIEQINLLNIDFRARNSDVSTVPEAFKHLVTDTNIEFRLAVRDPNNKPTDGIIYTSTQVPKFFLKSDNVKSKKKGGDDPWDTSRFLNIWVCDLDQFMGYAWPIGVDRTISKEHDGVVIRSDVFGRTNSGEFALGRTLTHETGHWLDLFHIWGDCNSTVDPCCSSCDDDDMLPDTPTQDKCNEGKNIPPGKSSCGNSGDLYVNYMDYVDDSIMVMFTADQTTRMWSTLRGPRSRLLSSQGLIPITSSNLFH